jgi:CubicO group peptidase (beta-lactamase class C family)
MGRSASFFSFGHSVQALPYSTHVQASGGPEVELDKDLSRFGAQRVRPGLQDRSHDRRGTVGRAQERVHGMAWSTDAARPLTEAFNGALGAPGTVIAVACIDDAETVIQVNPGDTPADGRFEVGSVTKTMTATLLALLAAGGSLRLDDEVGRWLPACGVRRRAGRGGAAARRRRSRRARAVLQLRLPAARGWYSSGRADSRTSS